MGVHGLWRLIEPSGKPVPLETLENKILAVDVSLWLHQAIKGFQDSKGAPLPNAHLLGIYHRVCKLLYFRVRPVFVFDGGVPVLKKQTINKRNLQRNKNISEAERIQKQLLNTLLKHSAVNKVLAEIANLEVPKDPNLKENLYELPPVESASSSDEEPSTGESSPTKWDLHTIDEKSAHFKSLPADVRHEILSDLKETRKQSSWGKIHELPKESGDFSIYQMKRLLKRNSVQVSLEEAEKEMGGHTLSLKELENLLYDQGVINENGAVGKRIASDESTRFLFIKDVRKAMDHAKKEEEKKLANIEEEDETVETEEIQSEGGKLESEPTNAGDLEFEEDMETAIQLSLEDVPSTSKASPQIKRKVNFSFLENFTDADFQSESSENEEPDNLETVLASAKSYMMEYSGLTPSEIAKIISSSKSGKNKLIPKIKKRTEKENKTEKPVLTVEILNAELNSNSTKVDVPITENAEIKNKVQVEIISDTDSESSNDFVEVANLSLNKSEVPSNNKSSIEVIINPTDDLDDDIFSDIFFVPKNETEKERIVEEIEESPEKQPENKSSDILSESAVPEKIEELEKQPENKSRDILSESPAISEEPEKKIQPKPNLIEELLQPFKNTKNVGKKSLSVQQLQEIETNLVREREELVTEKSSKERLAGNITDQINREAQELLRLFGVPYIVAPMEAEAQCAFLDAIELTDGTITDDSDIWLFGGRTVYKNFFNQDKHVLEFRTDDITHHFKLTREQMILLALLVGSDYTSGIQGIGPVTALEVLAAFPAAKVTDINLSDHQLISGLKEFHSWFTKGRSVGPGRTRLRNKLKNIVLSENFPNLQVVRAYLEPCVDSSKEKFSWAKPNIIGLVDFARAKFGWTSLKAEEILRPVIKKMEETHSQKSIRDYFKTSRKVVSMPENKMSKRVKKAVDKIGTEKNDSSDEDVPKKKKKKSDLSADEDVKVLKEARKRSKKKVEEIEMNVKKEIAGKEVRKPVNLHKKEVIPQKEKDKIDTLRSKLKAIEAYRKSKKGPGFVKRRGKVVNQPKEDAELSESSSD